MRILDKYISQNFLGTMIFALISFAAIYVVIDLVGFLDKFIDQNVSFLIVGQYYLYYLPYILILTLPVATLLASLFSVGQLARYSELIAMQASGLSLYRILYPLVVLGIFISLIATYVGERFVPYANQKKKEVYETHVNKTKRRHIKGRTKDINLQIDENRWLLIGVFDTKINTAFKVSIQDFEGNMLIRRVDAPQMEWDENRWILKDGYIRHFKNNVERAQEFKFYELKNDRFNPMDIAKIQKKHEEMSYWELKNFIEEVKRTGGNPDRWRVDLYLKFAFPFANFIIILFGAPLASRKTRSGTAISFGVSLFVCFLYFGFIKIGQSLGHNGTLPPLLAAWLGNIFFGLGAIFIFVRSSK